MNSIRKTGIGALLVAGALTGGALGANFIGSAGAATSTGTAATSATSSGSSSGSGAPAQAPDPSQGGHVANGITETVLTGDTATKVTAAAQQAVSGGTVDRVETDAEGATYEAHVTKADGSKVTVKVNADFSVASVETGMA
jgi:hypothetical protein